MREAIRPIRSLFMYPGQRRVVVLAAMIVETYGDAMRVREEGEFIRKGMRRQERGRESEREREKEREREREKRERVPVDLSVKTLGLEFSVFLLLFCSKQCYPTPPVYHPNEYVQMGKGHHIIRQRFNTPLIIHNVQVRVVSHIHLDVHVHTQQCDRTTQSVCRVSLFSVKTEL